MEIYSTPALNPQNNCTPSLLMTCLTYLKRSFKYGCYPVSNPGKNKNDIVITISWKNPQTYL